MRLSSDKDVVPHILTAANLGPQVDPALQRIVDAAHAAGVAGPVWQSEGSYAAHSGRPDAKACELFNIEKIPSRPITT